MLLSQAGKSQAKSFIKMLSGYAVKAETVSGDKATRAAPFAAQVNVGNVRMLKGDWNKAYIEELRNFPNGKHDDRVDASSDAFNELNDIVPGQGLFDYIQQMAQQQLEREASEQVQQAQAEQPQGGNSWLQQAGARSQP